MPLLYRTADAAADGMQQMPDMNDQSHWVGSKQLMLLMLALWLLFSVVVHVFIVPLNQIIIPYLDLPLGFFMAAQGALITFVVMLFVFARRQERIDRDHFIDRG
jgi:putative solute:sodium symporter small subunit